MSIKNFSKDVLLISAEYSDFDDLDNATKNLAIKCINRVVSRLSRLGFTDYKIVGDDSLSIEIEDALLTEGHKPTIYDMYPNTVKNLLETSIINKSRTRYFKRDDLTSKVTDFNSDKLMSLEMKLSDMLSTEVIMKEDISDEKKIETVLRVIALTYYGIPINERSIFRNETALASFFGAVEKTREEMVELIKSDLDYRWEWAKSHIYGRTTKLDEPMNDEEVAEEFTPDDARMMEIMSLLNNTSPEKSNLVFGIDESKLDTYDTPTIDSDAGVDDSISLTEGLTTLSKSDFIKRSKLIDELTNVLKVIDEYTGVIYTDIVEECNLIVDLYVRKQATRSKKLPYENNKDNKILISVDIKTGDVEAIFKGMPFKLNPMFEKGETVKTNVLEW